MANEVLVTAKKLKNRKKFYKQAKWILLFILIFLIIVYIILEVTYNGGHFTISLDKNTTLKQNLVLYEDIKYKEPQVKLSAGKIDFLDNISIDWIPKDIDSEKDGSHNGDNYIAYTFYVINSGKEKVNYWYEIDIDDTIKNVDEAIRIMIYRNGERTVYAKKSKDTGQAEPGTKKFISSKIAVLEQRKNFKPSSKDRYTVVVWIEGDDPECKNDLLGGEIKLHMDFTEEHVDK